MSKGYQVELDNLERAGTETFPQAVDNIVEAVSHLDRAREEEATALQSLRSSLCDEPYTLWKRAIEPLEEVLLRNRDNVELSRQALVEAHRRYTKAEGLD